MTAEESVVIDHLRAEIEDLRRQLATSDDLRAAMVTAATDSAKSMVGAIDVIQRMEYVVKLAQVWAEALAFIRVTEGGHVKLESFLTAGEALRGAVADYNRWEASRVKALGAGK